MKKLISLILVFVMMFAFVFTVSAQSTSPNMRYEESFVKFMNNRGYHANFEGEQWYMYYEHYEYYSESNTTDTPDWVLAFGASNGLTPTFCYGFIGDYYMQKNNSYRPNALGYYVYVPSEDTFYSFENAWINQIEGIEKAFTDYLLPKGVADYIGNVDGDSRLSIADATFIQRALVGLSTFDPNDDLTKSLIVTKTKVTYISDMNRDGERTIADATAIQRKIAGLDI